MSWQLGAFSILTLALAFGFGWYERARPDARIVALVATLAALAAIGRIAFAALPNVKPTTDIVLVSGYALGGAPGFAVGALAGLTSNFFFGQGPWTPWQMAGWGATGMIGAGLAIVTGRRMGRLPLAAVCGLVGFAFAALQDVGDWVTFSDHSAAQLGIYVGKGIGFDAIHAVSCVVFALVFGPSLTRSIQRFARRLDVTWEPVRGASGMLAVVAAIIVWLVSQPALRGGGEPADAASIASTPTTYLLSAQNGDGGFGAALGQPSSPLYSGWAALGLAAEGRNPQDIRHGGASLIDYIRRSAGQAGDPGSIERTILVARSAGMSAGAFGGEDLVRRLEDDLGGDGSVSDQVNLTAFAVLALRAGGIAPPGQTLSWLARQQDSDGGFNFATAGGSSDVDDTGAALQALAGAGGSTVRARSRAVAFIARQQNPDGGFPSDPGGESNAQSTAWAIQGLIAAGADPSLLHRAGAPSPLQYLSSLIAADGHVRYSRSSDQTPVWVTGEALMALAGKALPLEPMASAHGPATVTGRSASHRPASATSGREAMVETARAGGRRSAARRARAGSADVSAFAADAGCAMALALAPVGLG